MDGQELEKLLEMISKRIVDAIRRKNMSATPLREKQMLMGRIRALQWAKKVIEEKAFEEKREKDPDLDFEIGDFSFERLVEEAWKKTEKES